TVVTLDPDRPAIALPQDAILPEGGVHIRWPDGALEKEERQHRWKLDLAQAFARANGIDRVVIDAPRARLGIVTVGKSYPDVRQALDELGLDDAAAAALGIRLYKVGMPWPLEPQGLRAFAQGLDEILVIEEKRALIEPQIRDILYPLPDGQRPAVIGKKDESGAVILPSWNELSPAMIAGVIAACLQCHSDAGALAPRVARLLERLAAEKGEAAPLSRIPYFCSGCPHSSSTRIPQGSEAFAGIGCHYLVQAMDRNTMTFTQMGAEGANWIGLSPFRAIDHVFVNIGDGTYVHSGLLAIRAAVAAKVNVTYKILYNDAVAMTGGQTAEGHPGVDAITHQLHGEGVTRIVVVSDEPEKYGPAYDFAAGVTLHHRSELDRVQQDLRTIPGVTALIYDQLCATEKRRRRKRGTLADPDRRVFINEAVCEGCGDCGRTSNCLSVIPVETEFGRKRQIDQSSCNKDMTCVDGFCPSFVTVEGGTPRKPRAAELGDLLGQPLPEPVLPGLERPWSVLIAGVGGTGVVTIAQLLAWAAHIDGRGVVVLDQIGLAQKYGGVTSHVRIAASPEGLHASKIGVGGADLLLGCDLVQAASAEVVARCDAGRTTTVLNDHGSPTGDFTRQPDAVFPGDLLNARLDRASSRVIRHDITAWATTLFGDSIAGNTMLLGAAWQAGQLPLSLDAIEQAIALNGVAVEGNRRAFRIGRLAVAAPERVAQAVVHTRPPAPDRAIAEGLDAIVARRIDYLTRYQDAAYGARYGALVARVAAAEQAVLPGESALTQAVARGYHKLLAYKDEYEVARLYSDGAFRAQLAAAFEGKQKLSFHLAPPLLARTDPATGRPAKQRFGPWVMTAFGLLARLKGLRGSAFDPFGRTAERRAERALITAYEADVALILDALTPANHRLAVALADLPQEIRGFGPIKMAAIEKAAARAAQLRDVLVRQTAERQVAAE
ncbi:MAG: indolepyruvate ferredoxin oxidoreductase family protein, partial [Proteobacteria bacterium]|nr:indolepyruvate ferredoxin oxidoreductase family protein [Pseudomonadota bacterium]